MNLAIVMLSAFGLAYAYTNHPEHDEDKMFAQFIAEHKRLRMLTTPSEEENATVVQTVAASPYYEDMKERFCKWKGLKLGIKGECEDEVVHERKRRLNEAPPEIPAFLFPDEHVGSAANFEFPCFPLGTEGDGWVKLEPNDDFSFELVLQFDFQLYGTLYPTGTTIYLNNNGNLSFENPISSFTASSFPISSPMIAPFWSDVDTRGAGDVWYKFFPEERKLSVIWDKVGYYPSKTNRLNTFQVVISDGLDKEVGLGSNVCFCYVDMDWTTGGASGGMHGFGGSGATVGVNRGIENDYIQIGVFNDTGSRYDGPSSMKDGVDFLDFKGSDIVIDSQKKGICFQATGINAPPVSSDFPRNNSITIPCGSVADLTVMFASPELNQRIFVSPSGIPTGMSINQDISAAGDVVKVHIHWEPDHATQHGIFEVSFFVVDDYKIPANITEVLSIDVSTCHIPEPDIPIMCMNSTTLGCHGKNGPFCTPYRSPEHCYADESFPLLITNRRIQSFENPSLAEYEGFWFHFLEDKAAQHAFSASQGYPIPNLYCCVSETSDLEDVCFAQGHSIPTAFTIRETKGHSGKNIFVLPYGFGGIDLISGQVKTLEDVQNALGPNVDKILVEEFIDGSEFGSIPSLPTEYKFHMFGGTIGAIDVVYNKGTACSCYAVVDEDWNRLDKHGCFFPQPAFGLDADGDKCYDIDWDYGKNHPIKFKDQDLCGQLDPPDSCIFTNLKALAREISEVLGVYMRIDFFVDGKGMIFVQEFTSNHAGGQRHCAAKVNQETGCVDSCFLGKLWKEKSEGTIYGGPQTTLPTILNGWRAKGYSEQCTAAIDAISMQAYTPVCKKS